MKIGMGNSCELPFGGAIRRTVCIFLEMIIIKEYTVCFFNANDNFLVLMVNIWEIVVSCRCKNFWL